MSLVNLYYRPLPPFVFFFVFFFFCFSFCSFCSPRPRCVVVVLVLLPFHSLLLLGLLFSSFYRVIHAVLFVLEVSSCEKMVYISVFTTTKEVGSAKCTNYGKWVAFFTYPNHIHIMLTQNLVKHSETE